MDTTTHDPSKFASLVPNSWEYVLWLWHHPLAQPALGVLLLLLLLFFVRGWLWGMIKFFYNCAFDFVEGKHMDYRRGKETDAIVADGVYELLIKLEESDKLSQPEKDMYLKRFGNLVPLYDLLPKNDQLTLKDKLLARWNKLRSTAQQHPRDRLAMMLRGTSTTTAS